MSQPTEGAPLAVLLADATADDADRVAAALAEESGEPAIRLTRATRWADAAGRIDRGEVDALLLGLPGGEQGVLPLLELRARAPELPIVVLTSAADEPLAVKAVQLGATDYLVSEKLYGTLVARCVRHAVEAERVRSRLRERREHWPSSLRPTGDPAGRAASLHQALPQAFDELVADYGRLLDHAVEQVLRRTAGALDDIDMGQVARRAGALRAGPRDVIEIHSAAIKIREQETGAQRMRIYAAEGQIRLLELMGHLVTFYRSSNVPGMEPGNAS